ncbi:MAG: O-antigen ligase family protein [Candidatus Ruminococcus intestinipullorum]|nr:O-antigen ligase family protein [Candidatus Ruminococcus intestinipullorum]
MNWTKKCIDKLLVDTNPYIYTAILMFMLDEILFIHTYIGGLLKLFIVWGFAIIIVNFYNDWKEKRSKFYNKYFFLIICFILSYAITIVINRESYVIDNVKIWCYMIAFFFCFYGIQHVQSVEEWKESLYRLSKYIVGLTFVFAVVCLLTYTLGINIQLHEPDGYTHIGMYDHRLWGVYNPNVGATLNVISAIFTLGLFFEKKGCTKSKKIFLCVNFILQYCQLLLTGSRTSLVTLLLGVMLFFFFIWKEKKKLWNRILISALIGIFLFGIYQPVKVGLSYIPGTVKQVVDVSEILGLKDESNAGKKTGKRLNLTRKEKEEDRSGGFLTGRQYLWKAGIKALEEHPLFGISKAGTYDKAKPYIEDDFWLLSLESSLHNSYITVLVASGIVGFILFMMFLILNIKDYIRLAFQKGQNPQFTLYITLLIVIAMMMITECLEGRIIYRTEVFNVLFWTFMGIASQYTKLKEREGYDTEVTG